MTDRLRFGTAGQGVDLSRHPDLVLRSARAKIERVKTVLAGMSSEARYLAGLQDDEVVIELDPARTRYAFYIDGLIPAPPEWPVVIGEILFNLRSALDHVAYALAAHQAGDDFTDKMAAQSEFPIYTAPERFRANAHKIAGLSAETKELIERVQPFPGRTAASARADIDEVPEYLGLLHDLNRVEKHRLPPIVSRVLSGGSWLSGWPEPIFREGPLSPGCLVAEMSFTPEYRPERDHQPRFAFDYAIDFAGRLLNMPGTLDVLHLMVERVIDALDDSAFYRTRRRDLLRTRPIR